MNLLKLLEEEKIRKFFQSKLSRRSFIGIIAAVVAVLTVSTGKTRGSLKKIAQGGKTLDPRKGKGVKGDYDLVVCKGKNPANSVKAAITALGGMERFVSKGDIRCS